MNPTFTVNARTLLHLGAELISSDSIALYELIKNAYDAGSRTVNIDVDEALPRKERLHFSRRLEAMVGDGMDSSLSDVLAEIKAAMLFHVVPSAAIADDFSARVKECQSAQELLAAIRVSSRICVSDTGRGMTSSDLLTAFLTIGTRSKLIERSRLNSDRPILGEKGIGRLSVMRLGQILEVLTRAPGENSVHVLRIDWAALSHESDEVITDIFVESSERIVQDFSPNGTQLQIWDLNTSWTEAKLHEIAWSEFSKINDPFEPPGKRFPIKLTCNGQLFPIPTLHRVLLEHSHGHLRGTFTIDPFVGPRLAGTMTYGSHVNNFIWTREHLASMTSQTLDVLESLGPFDFEFYWFNRRQLKGIEGIGKQSEVRHLLSRWSGGLMLFRDGFRVLPYAGAGDDWLGLDPRALSRRSFKVNRQQLVGHVRITTKDNPHLRDQSNREGLKDSDEKSALISLLFHCTAEIFHDFLDSVDKASRKKEPAPAGEIEDRLESEGDHLSQSISNLMERVPAVAVEHELVEEILDGLRSIQSLTEQVREMAATFEERDSQLLNLAGVGISVEIVAHEINRATEHALDTLAQQSAFIVGDETAAALRSLRLQLQTLQKRLKILDPLSTSGRNRKEKFDVVTLINDVLLSHEGHFEREHIVATLQVVPHGAEYQITAVKGMIVQVLENLISNSVYWLRQRQALDPGHRSHIDVVVDTQRQLISFRDNGPGIPASAAKRVFSAFFTTKPGGRGKGLGLFIAREVARYNKAELELLDTGEEFLNVFILDLGEV